MWSFWFHQAHGNESDKNFGNCEIKVVKIDTIRQLYINHHANIMSNMLVYQSTNQCWPTLPKFFVPKFEFANYFFEMKF
jgi:hypothetical protein